MVTTRDIHPETYAAITDPSGFFPIVLFHVDWPGDPLHAHTNLGSLSWDGQTWAGVGNVADLALPRDTLGMAQQKASLSLLGFGGELDALLDTDARDRSVRVLFGAVTERDGSTLIGDPFEVFTGAIDGLQDVTEAIKTGRTRGMAVPLVSGPSQRARSAVHHSFHDQQAAQPGDTAGRLLINSEREGLRHRWPE
jgi:hypothetical protein